MTQFSARIKAIRKERKLTQKQMAEFLSTTERNYQYYESGSREPNLETFSLIAERLEVTTDYLLGKSEFPDYAAFEDTIPFPFLPVRLKALREQRGLTLSTVAWAVEESVRNYAGYEEGEVLPKIRTICALADYFDVSLDYLVGRSDVAERR